MPTFADRCHHAKEEDGLFPLMETRGLSPEKGPTAVMRSEHEQGRELLACMEQAIPLAETGHLGALRAWTAAAGQYVALLRAHIRKEDECLFPMAQQALDARDLSELSGRFAHVEREDIGPGVHEHYLAIADRLAERFQVRRDRLPEGAPRCGCHARQV